MSNNSCLLSMQIKNDTCESGCWWMIAVSKIPWEIFGIFKLLLSNRLIVITDSETTQASLLTHWDQVTHICVGKQPTHGSNNGLWPGRSEAIIWTSAGILLIGPLGTNFSEMLIGIQTSSFTKMHLKIAPILSRTQCDTIGIILQRE